MLRRIVLVGMLGMAAGCAPRTPVVAQAPVTDPYSDTGDGGAIYNRDLNQGGTATIRVLPGTPTPEGFRGVAGDTVTFAADQAVLSPEAREIVGRQAAWLVKNGGFAVQVEGHADDPGAAEYNLALGARRAQAVAEVLVSRGVAAGRITTVSYGRERPLAACTDEACFAKNRRAVTIVTPGAAI